MHREDTPAAAPRKRHANLHAFRACPGRFSPPPRPARGPCAATPI